MDFKNVNLKYYCFNLDLHKSMFFIDMLKDTHEFTLKGDEIEIFKKIRNGISEPITRKELIYYIQVEMAEKYKYSSIEKKHYSELSTKEKSILQTFYRQFEKIDSIHKTIDNIIYLEKRLKQPVIVQGQPQQKVILASAPPKNPEFGGWEEDEEEEEEKVSEEELKMESMRLLRKQVESPYEWTRSLNESDSAGSAARGPPAVAEEEEINELGENKKLVLKNALEKECLSARTELFRPAWRPPR